MLFMLLRLPCGYYF